MRKIISLSAAAVAALVFLGDLEIATSTFVRENTLSLHADQSATALSCLDEALTESAESSRAEVFGASVTPGFAGRPPQFIAARSCSLRETHHRHQNLVTNTANPRAPPALHL